MRAPPRARAQEATPDAVVGAARCWGRVWGGKLADSGWGYLRVIDPSGGGTGRVIAATGQLTGAHNLDAVKAALKTTR